VEQSALNGESEPVEISENGLSENFMDSRNIVFNGCLCLEGNAFGVAIKIGDNTYLGIIAQQTAQIITGETPLQKEIKSFVKFITFLGITLGTIVFSIGAARGVTSFLNLFVQGFIIVIIANIPQGLPATVVSCLTIIAYRMSKQNVYIKKLESIETLGSATVIASDKTGTLTLNRMTVEHVWLDSQIYSSEYILQNDQDFRKNKTWHQLFKIGVLCNKAFFQENKENFEKGKILENHDKDNFENGDLEKNQNMKKNLIENNVQRSDASEKKPSIKSNSQASSNLIRKLSLVQKKESVEIVTDNSEEIIQELKHQQTLELKKFQEIEQKKEIRKNLAIIGDATETAILRYCELFKIPSKHP